MNVSESSDIIKRYIYGCWGIKRTNRVVTMIQSMIRSTCFTSEKTTGYVFPPQWFILHKSRCWFRDIKSLRSGVDDRANFFRIWRNTSPFETFDKDFSGGSKWFFSFLTYLIDDGNTTDRTLFTRNSRFTFTYTATESKTHETRSRILNEL